MKCKKCKNYEVEEGYTLCDWCMEEESANSKVGYGVQTWRGYVGKEAGGDI